MIILYALIGALLNRWRGGGWPFLPSEVHGGPNDKKRTQVRRIVFSAGLGLLAWNPWLALVAFVSCLTGWGYPVSAAIGNTKPIEPEWAPLDWLAKPATRWGNKAYGTAWLTLHGGLFGALAWVATGSPWMMLWATMGVCYLLTRDWEYGEYAHGAVIGVAIGLTQGGILT